MRKIPTIFERTEDRRFVVPDRVTDGCGWVFDPYQDEVVKATRKLDGICVRHAHGNWWTRRQVKPGQRVPTDFAEVDHDPVTDIRTGWEPAVQSAYAKHIREAIDGGYVIPADHVGDEETFELVGPKVNGNPEHFEHHTLFSHHSSMLALPYWRDEDNSVMKVMGLAASARWEGVVWHHMDGRMAKLKVRDFPAGWLL